MAAPRVDLFVVSGEPRIPRHEAAAAFSSQFPQCFSDPSQPSIYFSGVSLQRGRALLQKLNLAFCLGAEVRHANSAAFNAYAFCPSFSQNDFRAQPAGDCHGEALCVVYF